jgi:hypothetical protein
MTGAPKPETDSARHFAAWLAALFLVVLGAKLWLVQLYGSPVWLWDQWYEVRQFFKPWLEGHATWQDYFAPYNEHRILFTRLLDLGVIRLNGRLEPLLQMTVNAFIHTGYVCLLAFWLWDFLGRKNGGLICCLLMPFFALPYAGENTIWAFDSQAYFQAVFSLMTLVWMGFSPVTHWRWWLGLVTAILGLFTMASGLLTPVAVAGLAIFRMLKLRRFEKNNLITLGAGVVVALLGKSLLVPFPADEPLKAHNFVQFAAAMLRYLMWPYFHAPEMALVIALPLILLAIVYFRRAFVESRAAEFLLLLGLWSLLQSVALAYGRGNFGEEIPASRYMDKLNVFVIASLFATVLLACFWMRDARAKKFALLPLLLFAAVIFFGLARISGIVVDGLLAPTRMSNLVAEERVQKLMTDGNEKDFFEAPTVRPDPKVIEGVLLDKDLQTIMPAANLAPSATPVRGRFSAVSDALWRHAVMILYAGLGLALVLVGIALVRSPLGLAWENAPGLLVLVALLASLGYVWMISPVHRETIERQLQNQLALQFKFSNLPERAAIHEQKAKALEGK